MSKNKYSKKDLKDSDEKIDEMVRNCTQNDDDYDNPHHIRSKNNNLQSGNAAAERFLAAVAKDMFFNDTNFLIFEDLNGRRKKTLI